MNIPPVRGTYTHNAPIARLTWFHVGGPAEILFKPADAEDLQHFMREKPANVPVTMIGMGSNMLVRDGGIPGVVIVLGKAFGYMQLLAPSPSGRGQGERADGGDASDGLPSPATLRSHALTKQRTLSQGVREECKPITRYIYAGAGTIGRSLALYAMEHELAGLEFLSGIPGTVGGAVAMNAGAYGAEVSDSLVSVECVMPDGTLHTLPAASLNLSYRHCELPEGALVTAATFQCQPDEKDAIRARIDAIAKAREDSQPLRTRTGGSTFKNPSGHKAWELVDKAGCRGFTVGGAQMSEKHCNFMINTGNATAADIEALGEEVRRRVKEATGVELQWEIRRVGATA